MSKLWSMARPWLKQAQYWLSEAVESKQRLVWSVWLAVIVGVAYFLSARLSLFLLTQPDGVAVFWPAAGVSAGILIALGRGARWPAASLRRRSPPISQVIGQSWPRSHSRCATPARPCWPHGWSSATSAVIFI